MDFNAAASYAQRFRDEDQRIAEQNSSATLTLWTGLGSILCLLVSCLLGSLRPVGNQGGIALAITGGLLLVSVLLFFIPSRRDERWYIVCSLLNHGGIGLASVLLLDFLELEIQIRKLLASGIPAAAILFGLVMFYISADSENRDRALYGGLAALVLFLLWSVINYFQTPSAFWMSSGICALLGCGSLGALIWTVRAQEQRSIFKALAVSSFAIYLLVLIAAIIAFFVAVSSASGESERSSKRKKRSRERSSGRFKSGRDNLGRLFHTQPVLRRRRLHFPYYLWYYTPSTRYAVIDSMEDLSDLQRYHLRARYRRRRRIVLACVLVFVLGLIFAAILLGRS